MAKLKFRIGTPNDDNPAVGTAVAGEGSVEAICERFPNLTKLTLAQILEDISTNGGHLRVILHSGSFISIDSAKCGHAVVNTPTESSWKN